MRVTTCRFHVERSLFDPLERDQHTLQQQLLLRADAALALKSGLHRA